MLTWVIFTIGLIVVVGWLASAAAELVGAAIGEGLARGLAAGPVSSPALDVDPEPEASYN